MSEFKLRYPGQYDEREAPLLEAFFAECKALNDRGPVDVQALISGTLPEGTPGIGPVIEATEEMVLYNNRKYNPENPLYNDAEYARKAGFDNIPAYLTFAAHDDSFLVPIPHGTRDVMLIAGLNHAVTAYKPICVGDTLYLVADRRDIVDITPAEGSVYRTFAMSFHGSIYNQKGEKVNSVLFQVRENLKTFKDGMKPAEFAAWEGPAWDEREDHKYTDEDWEFIKSVWAKEFRRGAEVLYWEDVNVGDEPAWTLDGPLDDTLEPIPFWGQGLGGSRSLKQEIMDPEVFKIMKRNPYDGIYRLEKRSMSYPEIPLKEIRNRAGELYDPREHTGFAENDDPMCQPPERAFMINYLGRDCAVRHITNWAGDQGFLENIRWGIMPDECMEKYGYHLPSHPGAVRFLDVLPDMKNSCLHHPMERDIYLIKSRVYDKHVEDGRHLVELAWWIESIVGDVIEEGQATVRLPSRG